MTLFAVFVVCHFMNFFTLTLFAVTLFEASTQAWCVETNLAARLHCPHCDKPDTNDHYRHFCRDPTVVAARRNHLGLLVAAIHTRNLKSTTSRALTAMHTLDIFFLIGHLLRDFLNALSSASMDGPVLARGGSVMDKRGVTANN